MSTKAQIKAKIDAIADGEENTAEEVRDFANGLLDELFPVPVYDNNNSALITSLISDRITYGINFTKSGNKVSVQGVISVKAFNEVPIGTDLIAFTDSQFDPSGFIIQNFKCDGIILRLADSKITASSLIGFGPAKDYYINFTYVTN